MNPEWTLHHITRETRNPYDNNNKKRTRIREQKGEASDRVSVRVVTVENKEAAKYRITTHGTIEQQRRTARVHVTRKRNGRENTQGPL